MTAAIKRPLIGAVIDNSYFRDRRLAEISDVLSQSVAAKQAELERLAALAKEAAQPKGERTLSTASPMHVQFARIVASIHDPRTARGTKALVAKAFGCEIADIDGPSRHARHVAARQTAMAMVRAKTGKSLPQIGRIFNGRHHTTVLHACRVVDAETHRMAAKVEAYLAARERLEE